MGKKEQLRNANRSGAYYKKNYGKKKVEPVSSGTGKMLIGKFKGYHIDNVPTAYLSWLLGQSNINKTGTALILEELKKRLENKK